ncbi:DNA repair protein RecO [Patescibacteria group bacterium]
MPSFTTKAVVLKNFLYKDTDKIYTLLSEDKGKISGIGKGVRKVSSRRGGNLDTLNMVEIQLNEHKSGQNYITEVKTIKSFRKIKENLELSNQAFYIAELVNKFVDEDESAKPVFDLIIKSLESLQDGNGEISLRVNKFEIKFMQLLGYQPPKGLLLKWKELIEERNYRDANNLIKDFVGEILQENLKSLELS